MESIITYTGCEEILICLESTEEKFLEEFFGASLGRDVEDYDRVAHIEPYAAFFLSTHIVRNS